MAYRRSARRAFGPRRNRTRSLQWTAIQELAFTNTALNTSRQVILFSLAGLGVDLGHSQTIYRIVGNIAIRTQADVVGIFHYGIYKSSVGAGSSLTSLDPDIDAELDYWMWWGAFAGTNNASTRLPVEGQSMNVDIKVKRTIDETEQIRLALTCDVAHSSLVNLRVLSKQTGT